MPRKPRSHVRILMYRTWPINNDLQDLKLVFNFHLVQVNLFLKATSNANHCCLLFFLQSREHVTSCTIPVLRNFKARMRNSWYDIKKLTNFTKIPLVQIKINFFLTSSKNLVTSYTLLSITNHDDPAWLCFLTSSKVYFVVSASAILLLELMKWLLRLRRPYTSPQAPR